MDQKLKDVDVVLGENGQVANYFNGQTRLAPKELESVIVSYTKIKNNHNDIKQTSMRGDY